MKSETSFIISEILVWASVIIVAVGLIISILDFGDGMMFLIIGLLFLLPVIYFVIHGFNGDESS